MESAASKPSRVSPKTKRVLEGVLTVIWLGGTAYLLEVLETGLWGPVVLLGFVAVVEVLFLRWNYGHWPGSDSTSA